jgi:hypothetical protein
MPNDPETYAKGGTDLTNGEKLREAFRNSKPGSLPNANLPFHNPTVARAKNLYPPFQERNPDVLFLDLPGDGTSTALSQLMEHWARKGKKPVTAEIATPGTDTLSSILAHEAQHHPVPRRK